MLAGQTRQQGSPQAFCAVATGATGQIVEFITAIEHIFAHRQQINILSLTRLGLLGFEENTQGTHLGRGQFLGLRPHGVALTLAGLEIGQLLGNVLGMLPGQTRKNRACRFALQAVTEEATSGNNFLGPRQIHRIRRTDGQRRRQTKNQAQRLPHFRSHPHPPLIRK
jgi:hypothetical protein